MIDLRLAADAAGGTLEGWASVFAVTTDSRRVKSGDLFVALKGERFDGHDFVDQAFRAGAAAALVGRSGEVERAPGRALLRVDDSLVALGRIAAWWRRRFALPLIAITGSNGKTTVKEMVAAILRAATGRGSEVLATEGNLNNEIGLPLTLLRIRPGHCFAVCEMGMNHPGEIAHLTRLAGPTVAAINNAAAAHLEGVGRSVADVARAKGELFEGLTPDGTAVVNADDEFAPLWRSLAGSRRTLEFGLAGHTPITGSHRDDASGTVLDLDLCGQRVTTVLKVCGLHNVRNALCAAACAVAAGASADAVAEGLGAFTGVKGRLQRKTGVAGATVIDDSYNANPASVQAAIDVLRKFPGLRILVLGDMRELGTDGPRLHREIGEYARAAGIQALFATGDLAKEAVAAFGSGARHFADLDALAAALAPEASAGCVVLVKGSRSTRMERIVAALAGEGAH